LEKCGFVDQKPEPKFATVREFILRHRDIFLRQGSVVSSWRTYRGHRLGPFFSVRFRIAGRQSAIYLGRSVALAEQVKGLLEELQQARMTARLVRQARVDLHKAKELWQQDLAAMGLTLKGFEVRGWHDLRKTGSPSNPDDAR
jgi:hypothetical protein